jgi:enoyl-CoA hydratase/carnithine racemase
MGATYFVNKCLGAARASELLLTARVIDAAEALRIGLISHSVGPEQLSDTALKIAGEIAECGPLATTQLVQSLRLEDSVPLEQALEREATMQAVSYASEEFKEGIAALREKRKPHF